MLPSFRFLLALLLTLLPMDASLAQSSGPERAIRYRFTVAAPPRDVWAAWTTEAGLRSFFSPSAKLDARLFGDFDIHQNPPVAGHPEASRPNLILAMQPERLLVTSWDAPVEFPEVRRNRTVLMVMLEPVDESRTRVTLVNSGYGVGGQWDQAFEYFAGAWTWVAAALQHRFAAGPLDWSAPPDLTSGMMAIDRDAATAWLRRMQRR